MRDTLQRVSRPFCSCMAAASLWGKVCHMAEVEITVEEPDEPSAESTPTETPPDDFRERIGRELATLTTRVDGLESQVREAQFTAEAASSEASYAGSVAAEAAEAAEEAVAEAEVAVEVAEETPAEETPEQPEPETSSEAETEDTPPDHEHWSRKRLW